MRSLLLTIICVLLFSIQSGMASSDGIPTIKEQMEKLNSCWKNKDVSSALLDERVELSSDVQLIQMHLSLVGQHLRGKSLENLSAQQKAKRLECLNVLEEYRLNGVFPKNTFHKNRTPYFIDIYGTACAVGQLIIESGYESFAKQISAENNYAYIHELDPIYPGLKSWADKHGFTLDELAWIQPGYSFTPCDTNCIYTASISPSTGQSPHTYHWSNGETTSIVSNLCPGNQYTCTIIDALGDTIDPMDCQISFYTGMILGNTVYLPAAQPLYIEHTTTNDEGNCNGTAGINITQGTPPYHYLWQPGYDTTQSIQGLCHGTYSVMVYDSNNCVRHDTMDVLLSVGINESDESTLSFYPNPSSDRIVIELEALLNDKVELQIRNMLGEIVYSTHLENKVSEINIAKLKNGVYFLSAGSEDKFVRKTLIKTGS